MVGELAQKLKHFNHFNVHWTGKNLSNLRVAKVLALFDQTDIRLDCKLKLSQTRTLHQIRTLRLGASEFFREL